MRRPANILFCCVCTLVALGTVVIFAIISARGSTLAVGIHYLIKHLFWVAIAMAGFLVARRLDYHLLHRFWWVIAGVSFLLLVAVLVPGVGTSKFGARRWIRFGPIGMQPSEMAKLGMLIALSAMAVRFKDRMRSSWRGAAIMLGVVGLTAALVLAGPDFSMAALIGMLGIVLLIASDVPLLPIAGASVAGVASLAVLLAKSPTRVARIFAFLDPWAHIDGPGYQAIQSLAALGQGGIVGRAGMPKPFFLPQSDTDFILAVIGEELGLLGTCGVLFLFLLIIRQGMMIAEAAPDRFGRLLAFGITVMIALQALIHIAVVTVSMPTTGISLPFVSSGGSSLLTAMTAAGILMNIARQSLAPAPAVMAEQSGEIRDTAALMPQQ